MLVAIAVVMAAMVGAISDSSTYANFSEAMSNQGEEFHVVGVLDKAHLPEYNPQVNPDEFKFFMVDNLGVSAQVVLHQSKPQDFDRAEQIVVIGEAQGEVFHASEILMKCPSKYADGTPAPAEH